jgi:large repetitive protein
MIVPISPRIVSFRAAFRSNSAAHLVRLVRRLPLLALAVFLAGAAPGARAQSTFPSTAVGSSAPAQNVTVTVAGTGTVKSVAVLTMGAANLDYTEASGGDNCVGISSGSCKVSVTFAPKYPGARNGAVVLEGTGNVVLGLAYITGSGQGSLPVLIPGTIDIFAGQEGQWTVLNDNHPATQADLNLPSGVAVDGLGDLFIADSSNNRVREVVAVTKGPLTAGDITTIAGTGGTGYDGATTAATSATLTLPSGVAVDGAGNVYIADTDNNVVREVNVALNTIVTVAGTGASGYTGDGHAATSAQLNRPQGVVVDGQGNVYIADTGNNVIREVSGGTITTIAGTGTAGFSGDGGTATAADLNVPSGVAIDPSGNLYIADSLNERIRVVSGGNINTYAGSNNGGYAGDGGAATAAELDAPQGVACDAAGNVFIADARNYVIRKVNAVTGKISTVAGNNPNDQFGDGKGGFTYGNGQSGEQYTGNGIAQGLPTGGGGGAGIYAPYGVTIDQSGNIFIAEYFDQIVREVNAEQATLFFSPQLWENQVSAPEPQAVENDGNTALSFTTISHDANAATDAASTTCSTTATVSADEQCIIGAEFAPTTAGNPDVGNIDLTQTTGGAKLDIATVGQSLAQNQVSVALTSTPNPSTFGQNVTFSVTVTQAPGSTQGTPTGTVTFADTFNGATNPIGGTPTLAAGKASFQISTLAVGTHVVVATYSGDTHYLTATSNSDSQVVTEQVTVVLINSSGNNPSILGANVTFQATVTVTGGVATTNPVSFYNGTNLLGNATPSAAGVATFTTATLPLGNNKITATYTDTNNVTATSNVLTQGVEQQTATTVTTSLTPSLHGAQVTFTATVLATGTVAPTGTVTFYDGATKIGTGTLAATGANSAAATLNISTLAVGTHSITATYGGDADDFGSTSPAISQVVQDATTGTALTASANPAIAGTTITFTARVTVTTGGGVPTGTVNFYNGTTLLGTGTLNGTGVATYATNTLPIGTYSITAVYQGDTNNTGSTSAALSLSVIGATTNVTLTASATAVTVNTPVTFTATVKGNGATPTGTVTFMDGATALGTGTLNAQGVATLTTSTLAVGQHSITAVYGGDANNAGATSSAVVVTVGAFATQTILAASATTITTDQQLTLLVTTTSASGKGVTGTITFLNGTTSIGTATLTNGSATLSLSLNAGSYTITAKYSGDTDDSPSTSNAITVIVTEANDFTIQLTPSSLTIPTTEYGITTINLTSENGFTDTLALGCASLPYSVTCSFTPTDVTLAANGNASVQLTVDTNSPLVSGGQAKNDMPGPGSGVLAACVFPGSALFGFAFWRFRKRHSVLKVLAIVAMLAGTTLLMNGCGGLSLNSAKAGSYTIQVIATGEKTGVTHVANLKVQVN